MLWSHHTLKLLETLGHRWTIVIWETRIGLNQDLVLEVALNLARDDSGVNTGKHHLGMGTFEAYSFSYHNPYSEEKGQLPPKPSVLLKYHSLCQKNLTMCSCASCIYLPLIKTRLSGENFQTAHVEINIVDQWFSPFLIL